MPIFLSVRWQTSIGILFLSLNDNGNFFFQKKKKKLFFFFFFLIRIVTEGKEKNYFNVNRTIVNFRKKKMIIDTVGIFNLDVSNQKEKLISILQLFF